MLDLLAHYAILNKIISENFPGVSIKMEKEVDVEDKISEYVLADIDDLINLDENERSVMENVTRSKEFDNEDCDNEFDNEGSDNDYDEDVSDIQNQLLEIMELSDDEETDALTTDVPTTEYPTTCTAVTDLSANDGPTTDEDEGADILTTEATINNASTTNVEVEETDDSATKAPFIENQSTDASSTDSYTTNAPTNINEGEETDISTTNSSYR